MSLYCVLLNEIASIHFMLHNISLQDEILFHRAQYKIILRYMHYITES